MSRLCYSVTFLSAVLISWSGVFQQHARGQGADPPKVEFIKPEAVPQEGNEIKWKFKVKPEGRTINKVTLDIFPRGGVARFGQPAPFQAEGGTTLRIPPLF